MMPRVLLVPPTRPPTAAAVAMAVVVVVAVVAAVVGVLRALGIKVRPLGIAGLQCVEAAATAMDLLAVEMLAAVVGVVLSG